MHNYIKCWSIKLKNYETVWYDPNLGNNICLHWKRFEGQASVSGISYHEILCNKSSQCIRQLAFIFFVHCWGVLPSGFKQWDCQEGSDPHFSQASGLSGPFLLMAKAWQWGQAQLHKHIPSLCFRHFCSHSTGQSKSQSQGRGKG